jgi:hypothetical protein
MLRPASGTWRLKKTYMMYGRCLCPAAQVFPDETWEPRELPNGVKPVPTKWVYKIKRNEHENIARYKARVVAKGFKQTKGVDYEEVFAPISWHVTVRTLLVLAAAKDIEVEQLDIKTAFLNGKPEKEIWMEQPEGFEVGGKNQACHLLKTLYGLKQAPKAWHLTDGRDRVVGVQSIGG